MNFRTLTFYLCNALLVLYLIRTVNCAEEEKKDAAKPEEGKEGGGGVAKFFKTEKDGKETWNWLRIGLIVLAVVAVIVVIMAVIGLFKKKS